MSTETATTAGREAVFEAFRRWGYLEADLDPLGRLAPEAHPELRSEGANAEEAREIYCGPLAVEMGHIPDPERRRWLAERMESPAEPEPDRRRILDRLIEAETFEQVLQARYLGEDVDPRSIMGAGDVKYHLGATGTYETHGGGKLHIHLVSNPSHLEAVDPVALGRTRAKQQRFADEEEEKSRRRVVPILLRRRRLRRPGRARRDPQPL